MNDKNSYKVSDPSAFDSENGYLILKRYLDKITYPNP